MSRRTMLTLGGIAASVILVASLALAQDLVEGITTALRTNPAQPRQRRSDRESGRGFPSPLSRIPRPSHPF
jgi:hypothetical protein